MNTIDWKIHKKLLDAGGVGDRVYILQGRGSGKLETERKMIERLEAAGRTVIELRPGDIQKARRMSAPVPDFDLLTDEKRQERAHWIIEGIEKAIKELKTKPMYLPEYEMFKDFYVLDKTKDATPYLHWVKSNPYLTTMYCKSEEDDCGNDETDLHDL